MKTALELPILQKTSFRTVMRLAALLAGLAGVAGGQVITQFPIPSAVCEPYAIAAGPDGNLWFAEHGCSNPHCHGNKIGRITTAGVITEFPVPTVNSGPIGMAAGADGNLWFTENTGNKIGRITPAGVITEFPVPTAGSGPSGMAAGADGNLWFTEYAAGQIGRITTAGVITEFSIPGGGGPHQIAAGPDGNLWFTEPNSNEIGRITTAGIITEFSIGTPGNFPDGIAAGPDGNVWFAEYTVNDAGHIGRITPAGVITEFPVQAYRYPGGIAAGADGNLWFTEEGGWIGRITTAGVITEFAGAGGPFYIAAGPDGNLWFTAYSSNAIARITTGPTTPQPMAVDARTVTGTNSNANGVLEPGETVQVDASWKNTLTDPQTFTGTASNLTGAPGPTYTINDGSADYGTINAGATGDCNTLSGDCYLMTVSGTRPAAHWDATFTENLSSNSISKIWTLHVGESFPDVPTSDPFYGFIENLFHNGVTVGSTDGNYHPTDSITRAQMAVFLLKSKFGASHVPPPATGTVFNDVHVGDFADAWIEELAGFQITAGCDDAGNYCPNNPVTRAEMAVFLLKSEHGSTYAPPPCAGLFADVECSPTPAFAVDWIERLYGEGTTGGCYTDPLRYCPDRTNTRGEMAVFLVKTFGLQLYGP